MYDPNDPGPVLKTYDPNWKARFDAKHGLLEELRGIPVREQVSGLRSYLTGGLCEAFLDRFKYKWQYEEFLQEQYIPWFLGKEEGQIDFPIPSPPHTATSKKMEAHYRHWNELAHDLQHYLSLDPAVEWDSGLFSERLAGGSTRETFDEVIEPSDWRASIRARFAVEIQGSNVHVCALQRDGADCGGLSLTEGIKYVAAWAAQTYLPQSSVLGGLLGRQKRLFLYRTVLPCRTGPFRQSVWGCEVRRSRGGVEMVDIGVREATPYLREEALKLHPELWKAVAAVRSRDFSPNNKQGRGPTG